MSFEKILVATDLSEENQVAVSAATDLARATGAEVVLLYATEIIETPEWSLPSEYERLAQTALVEDREKLDQMARVIAQDGVRVSTRVIDAPPARGILDTAEKVGAGLIVVGTHGRTGLKRFLLGSVAEHVVRHSSCSVWVAREGHGPGFRHHILVPIDFSAGAEAAADTAASLVEPEGQLTLLHCWSVPGVRELARDNPGAQLEGLDEACSEAVQRMGQDFVDRYRDASFAVEFEHVKASPRAGIQGRLDWGDIDLVVMGSHGRSGPARWLLGSVAEATVRASPCSVLVVRG